jgi:hypothetical protein
MPAQTLLEQDRIMGLRPGPESRGCFLAVTSSTPFSRPSDSKLGNRTVLLESRLRRPT